MGYKEWAVIKVINSFENGSISINNAQLGFGKFYKNGDKDAEISAFDVNGTTIGAGSSEKIASCGRDSTPTGTDGQLDIEDGETRVCTVYWSSPWGGGKENKFGVQDCNENYNITLGDWDPDANQLGEVEVDVSRKG